MVSVSDIWDEEDKKMFAIFVNILIKLKIFKLKRYSGRLKNIHVSPVTGTLVARWEKKSG